jgi:hypothetical protein
MSAFGRKALLTAAVGVGFVLGGAAFAASGKYCVKNAKTYDIHLFGHTYSAEQQTRMAKKALTDLKAKFNIGETVRLFSHTPTGFNITMDSCVPGCPERSGLEQFFSSDCSAQVAKRDRINFERQFAEAVLRNFGKPDSRPSYDIFKSVQALNDAFRAGNQTNDIYAVISLVPQEVKNPRDRREWNSLLRKADETLQFPKNFPAVQILGAATDAELIDFWEEVFRSKGSFNFVSY